MRNILSDQQSRAILMWLLTAFACAAMHIFSMVKGFEGSIPWLRRMWPERSDAFYHRVDFVMVVLIGSIIGYLLFRPEQIPHALTAGFGWIGAVSILVNKPPTETTK